MGRNDAVNVGAWRLELVSVFCLPICVILRNLRIKLFFCSSNLRIKSSVLPPHIPGSKKRFRNATPLVTSASLLLPCSRLTARKPSNSNT